MKPWAIAIQKPVDMTSFDVIRHFKRTLSKDKIQKIGHLGTLDPFADGVLIVTACGGSRIQDFSHQFLTKTYRATGTFGVQTNTADVTGEVINTNTAQELKSALEINWKNQFQEFQKKYFNSYYQNIPQFSASKVDGRPMYELARKGIKIEKPPKLRWITKLEFEAINGNEIIFSVECSGGTYIRQLFEDMAADLGLVGNLRNLTRTAIGNVSQDECVQLEDISESGFDNLKTIELFRFLPFKTIVVNSTEINRLENGQPIEITKEVINDNNFKIDQTMCINKNEYCWALTEEKEIVSMLEIRSGKYWPKINF